jgi:hypothetical protein
VQKNLLRQHLPSLPGGIISLLKFLGLHRCDGLDINPSAFWGRLFPLEIKTHAKEI